MCYTARDAVDWFSSPTARAVHERLRPQPFAELLISLIPPDGLSGTRLQGKVSVDDSITIFLSGGLIMICVEIDVAKDQHDCFILSLDGEVLADVFTIPNNRDGFENLFQHNRFCSLPADKIKVGFEATGH